jgi:hypothetical protein
LDKLSSPTVALPVEKTPSISSKKLEPVTYYSDISTHRLDKISRAFWIHQDGWAYARFVDHPRSCMEWCHS